VFSHPALDKIDASVLERVVVCDTIPVDPLTRPAKIEVLSVAGILAQTIDNVFRDDSVSAIFKGENQLF
jgi:ribose-phosphate pyrophosphokinase